MAITKQCALELLKEELKQVGLCEDIIDEKIRETYQKEKHIFVDLKELNNPSARVIAELLRIYEQAGWKVDSIPNQKDGNYLEFF